MAESDVATNDKVIIFDTTLRDGEQSAGAGLTPDEKFRIARQLQKLGVDVIEAGFAASSPGDFEAVQRIAREIDGPVIFSNGFFQLALPLELYAGLVVLLGPALTYAAGQERRKRAEQAGQECKQSHG